MAVTEKTDETLGGPGSMLWAVGLLLLVAAAAASGVMALKALDVLGETLPGCGPASACYEITSGLFGSIPGLGWPVSFIGLAWFCGLIVAWSSCLGGIPAALRWLIRLGAVMSLMFLVIMVVEGILCPYCLTTQLCNIAFWGLVEFTAMRRDRPESPAIVVWLATFAVVSLFLGLGESHRNALFGPAWAEAKQSEAEAMAAGQAAPEFTGRYVLGPEDAPIKIVMFTDYQCADCQRFERQISRLIDRRDDVSLSIKHNPFNTDCNPHVGRTRHPMACVAAQAVETAGILQGEDAFWTWHDFLIMNKGEFEPGKRQQVLPSLVEEMGFDRRRFRQIMFSDHVMDLIAQDVAEADELGIFFTPMIFINGVQWKWSLPGNASLNTVINRISAAIESGDAAAQPQQPDTKAQKIVADWRDAAVEREGVSPAGFRMNDVPDAIRVTIYGDYVSDKTKWMLDEITKASQNTGIPVSIETRVYPFGSECNDSLPGHIKDLPGSCLTSRAAKAAALIGGEAAHRAVHDHAFANQSALGQMDEGDWAAVVAAQGVNPAEFVEMVSDPRVDQLIAADLAEHRRLRHRHVPTLRIEQKIMPRWYMEGEPVIDRVLEEAAQAREVQGAGPVSR